MIRERPRILREWVDPEPPADDDAPARSGPPIEELPVTAQDARVQHDLDVANDWHDTGA